MKNTPACSLLFVYGTLRKGQRNFESLGRPKPLGKAWISGTLYEATDFAYPYPAATLGGKDRIVGELYDLGPETACLKSIDELEGFDADDPRGSAFLRARVEVQTNEGPKTAWMYALNPERRRAVLGPAPRRIPSGDWAARVGQDREC